LPPAIVDTFYIKKNGKGLMKENYNLVKSCQDTAEQLRLRTGLASQGRGQKQTDGGQRPGWQVSDQLGRSPRPGLLRSPWPKGKHNLRNDLFEALPPHLPKVKCEMESPSETSP